MTIAGPGRAETRPCSRCGAPVEHRESVTASCRPEKLFWMAEKHLAPCGLPCIGGGVTSFQVASDGAHGYQDGCPRCGPLRVLPEVVAEMRDRAEVLHRLIELAQPLEDTGHSQSCRCHDCTAVWLRASDLATGSAAAINAAKDTHADLLRSLDEIDKLRAELASAREAIDAANQNQDEQ